MSKKRLIRILSLDGGGIRGLLTAHILAALENKLNERWKLHHNGRQPEHPLRLAQFFDMLAGTSTGGILTCILLKPDPDDPRYPRFGAAEAISLYKDYGQQIFHKSMAGRVPLISAFKWPKYDGLQIEQILSDKLGDSKLSDLIRPCLITSYDIEKRRAIFFTSHDAKEKGPMFDFFLRDVARCTSAAPTYFPPHQARSSQGLVTNAIDGGLFANNPTMCAVIEALKLFGEKSESGEIELLNPSRMFILSVGTGAVKKPYLQDKAVGWGMISWVAPIIDIMMSGVSETVDYQLRKLYSSIGLSHQYHRLVPQLHTADSEMDNVSEKNIAALNQAGIQNAYDMDDQLNEIADRLIEAGPVQGLWSLGG
jgi:patatin-like phospholipase/acyl hydrolase